MTTDSSLYFSRVLQDEEEVIEAILFEDDIAYNEFLSNNEENNQKENATYGNEINKKLVFLDSNEVSSGSQENLENSVNPATAFLSNDDWEKNVLQSIAIDSNAVKKECPKPKVLDERTRKELAEQERIRMEKIARHALWGYEGSLAEILPADSGLDKLERHALGLGEKPTLSTPILTTNDVVDQSAAPNNDENIENADAEADVDESNEKIDGTAKEESPENKDDEKEEESKDTDVLEKTSEEGKDTSECEQAEAESSDTDTDEQEEEESKENNITDETNSNIALATEGENTGNRTTCEEMISEDTDAIYPTESNPFDEEVSVEKDSIKQVEDDCDDAKSDSISEPELKDEEDEQYDEDHSPESLAHGSETIPEEATFTPPTAKRQLSGPSPDSYRGRSRSTPSSNTPSSRVSDLSQSPGLKMGPPSMPDLNRRRAPPMPGSSRSRNYRGDNPAFDDDDISDIKSVVSHQIEVVASDALGAIQQKIESTKMLIMTETDPEEIAKSTKLLLQLESTYTTLKELENM